MDLIKIGKYIAGKRKGLGLTQRQLAEKLGMSDKSVSKWERGVCLPDVSVYQDLCLILGITINEFIAGEDIPAESIVQKTEENIIGVSTDSKKKQRKLKSVIWGFVAIFFIALIFLGVLLIRSHRPKNYIYPIDRESIEMKTAEMLAGIDGAYIYKYVTTDDYSSLKIFISRYESGILADKQDMEIEYEGIGSPENGNILIVPDFKNFVIKLIIANEGSKLLTEIPILEGVEEREYYGRTAKQINGKIDIHYNEEQGLVALICDNDKMRTLDLQDIMNGNTEYLEQNDYVYCFSFEFIK